jgi:hypothetical protein
MNIVLKNIQLINTCSICLAIKESQIKTTRRFLFTPVRLAIIKKTNSKCWGGYTHTYHGIYSAINNNKIMSLAGKWMEHNAEINQAKYHALTHLWP